MSQRIVIGGWSNCGKSTLTASIYSMLNTMNYSVGIHEIDIFSNTIDCILGKKNWDEKRKNPGGKDNWNNPKITEVLDKFSSDTHDIVLGDLPGGYLDELLVRMVSEATEAIVVGKDIEGIQDWVNFFEQQNIPVILKIIFHKTDEQRFSFSKDISFLYSPTKRQVIVNKEIIVIAHKIARYSMQVKFSLSHAVRFGDD